MGILNSDSIVSHNPPVTIHTLTAKARMTYTEEIATRLRGKLEIDDRVKNRLARKLAEQITKDIMSLATIEVVRERDPHTQEDSCVVIATVGVSPVGRI